MLKKLFLLLPQKPPKKYWATIVIFLSILFFLLISRFLWINKFPSGIGYDELQVVLSAKSIWLTGKDISLSKFPLSLFVNNTDAGLAGLPSFLLAPLLGWQRLTLTDLHLLSVLLNLGTLAILALLAYKLTSNKVLLVSIIFFGLVNPWFYAYSRMPTEAPFAIFFVILGTYLLFSQKGSAIYYSLIPFIFAFFSYFGIKPILILLVPCLLLIHYKFINKTDRKHYVTYLLLILVVFVSYFVLSGFFSSENTLAYRISRESVFSGLDRYSAVINEERRAIIASPLNNLIFNKPFALLNDLSKKYIGFASPDFLFFGGDPRAMYRFGDHGMFYALDIVFFLLGIAGALTLKGKKVSLSWIMFTFIGLAPISSAINTNGDSYFFRSSLLIPGLILLLSLGYIYLFDLLKGKYRVLFVSLSTMIYIIFFIGFGTFFFFRYPIKEFENQYTDARILSNYLIRSSLVKDQPITLVTTSASAAYYQLLFYSESFRPDKFKILPPAETYQFGNIFVTQDCSVINDKGLLVVDSKANCQSPEKSYISIQNPKDAGVEYKLFNDSMCGEYELNSYNSGITLADYDIEILTNEQFCKNWITE